MMKIIFLMIGLLLFGFGIYYRNHAQNDPEAKKIYTITAIAGAVVALIAAAVLLM